MVIPPLLALLLGLCLMAPFTGWWSLLLAGGVLAFDALSVRMRLRRRRLPVGLPALLGSRLRALGSLIYYLCYHLIRYYAIPLMIGALLVPSFWMVSLGVLLCAARVDHAIKKPQLLFPVFTVIYLLEQLAYGAGVFWGCLSRKCFTSYRVVILRHLELTA